MKVIRVKRIYEIEFENGETEQFSETMEKTNIGCKLLTDEIGEEIYNKYEVEVDDYYDLFKIRRNL